MGLKGIDGPRKPNTPYLGKIPNIILGILVSCRACSLVKGYWTFWGVQVPIRDDLIHLFSLLVLSREARNFQPTPM